MKSICACAKLINMANMKDEDLDAFFGVNLLKSQFSLQLTSLTSGVSLPLAPGDSVRSEGCPLLPPRERLHHAQGVSLHYHPGGGSRYETTQSSSVSPVGACSLSMLQWAFSLSPSHFSLAARYRESIVSLNLSHSLTLLSVP